MTYNVFGGTLNLAQSIKENTQGQTNRYECRLPDYWQWCDKDPTLVRFGLQ